MVWRTNTDEDRLLVTIDGRQYALPVPEVQAVLRLRRTAVSPVPFDVSGRIRGIFNHKGSVVALLRREDLTAAADRNEDEMLTVVLLQDGEKPFALIVDAADAVAQPADSREATALTAHGLYCGDGA